VKFSRHFVVHQYRQTFLGQ